MEFRPAPTCGSQESSGTITRWSTHALRLPAAQHVSVVDRVATYQRRQDECQDLTPRPSHTRPLTKIDRIVDDLLDPEPPSQRARQHQARISDRALTVKAEHEPVQLPSTAPRRPPLPPPYGGPPDSRTRGSTPLLKLWCAGLARAGTATPGPLAPAG